MTRISLCCTINFNFLRLPDLTAKSVWFVSLEYVMLLMVNAVEARLQSKPFSAEQNLSAVMSAVLFWMSCAIQDPNLYMQQPE